MTRSGRILAFALAGGEGRRLRPLTADRAKPAVRFAGDYRIVDPAPQPFQPRLADPAGSRSNARPGHCA